MGDGGLACRKPNPPFISPGPKALKPQSLRSTTGVGDEWRASWEAARHADQNIGRVKWRGSYIAPGHMLVGPNERQILPV